jgi:hypothetical protein
MKKNRWACNRIQLHREGFANASGKAAERLSPDDTKMKNPLQPSG